VCVCVCVCKGEAKSVAKVLKLNGIYLLALACASPLASRHQFKLNFHLPRLVCGTAGRQFVPCISLM